MDKIILDGKEVDFHSLVVEDAHTWDYPDFCDAYVSDGMFTDGSFLSDDQLYKLTEDGDVMASLLERKFF